MDLIFEHYKKTGYLHHAHVIEGAYDEVVPALTLALTRHLGIETKGNPDLTVEYHESLGIDEARSIKEAQTRAGFGGARLPSPDGSTRAIGGGGQARKIFIIGTASFTREAQNALLKTFEEPTAGTHFFIIIPRADTLLATLKSRVALFDGHRMSVKKDDTQELVEEFLIASLEERFTMAKKLTDKKAGETVDREKIHKILDHLERILYTRMAGKRETEQIFRDIYQAKTYLMDRGSSPKMLLEQLAIVLKNPSTIFPLP